MESSDWLVGKIAGKSANFVDYVRRALKKLHIETEVIFTQQFEIQLSMICHYA